MIFSTEMFISAYDFHIRLGFRRVMYSILEDFPDFVLEKQDEQGREIEYSLCGHSLGGVISCLLAASLQQRWGMTIGNVAVFGMPMFTDKEGSQKLSTIPIERVQHVLDPIGVGPTVSNINLVHIAARREIFLSIGDDSRELDSIYGKARTPTPVSAKFGPSLPRFGDFDLFQLFSDLDRKGQRIENTDLNDHNVIIGRESIRSTLSELMDPVEGIIPNALGLKYHLKYHSMSKYLEVLKCKQVRAELDRDNY